MNPDYKPLIGAEPIVNVTPCWIGPQVEIIITYKCISFSLFFLGTESLYWTRPNASQRSVLGVQYTLRSVSMARGVPAANVGRARSQRPQTSLLPGTGSPVYDSRQELQAGEGSLSGT